MSDWDAIVAAVHSDVTLQGLIDGRIFPMVVGQQPKVPAITGQLVSQPAEHTQDRAFYRWPRWRFRIISDKYADLEPIAAALAGLFEDPTRTPFRASWIDGTTENREPQSGRFWRLVDVLAFQPAGPSQ